MFLRVDLVHARIFLGALIGLAIFGDQAVNLVLAQPAPTRPRGLSPGGTIMFVAPARHVDASVIQRVKSHLEQLGYRVLVPPHLDRQRGYLAGSDAERAAELMEAFRNPDVDAVFPLAGGYGTTRILDRLDYEVIAANPKILIGFSDITGLHLALAAKTRLVTFHSPNPDGAWGRPDGLPDLAERVLWRCVSATQNQTGHGFIYDLPPGQESLEVIRTGIAQGELTGGNLSLIASLMGTPYEIQTRGRVLFMEDVHEAPYRIDRYLSQLRLAGKLTAPAAVILGQFTEAEPEKGQASLTMSQVFADYFGDAPYPVIADFPAGHVPLNMTLPLGVRVEVDADRGRVRVLQAPVLGDATSHVNQQP